MNEDIQIALVERAYKPSIDRGISWLRELSQIEGGIEDRHLTRETIKFLGRSFLANGRKRTLIDNLLKFNEQEFTKIVEAYRFIEGTDNQVI